MSRPLGLRPGRRRANYRLPLLLLLLLPLRSDTLLVILNLRQSVHVVSTSVSACLTTARTLDNSPYALITRSCSLQQSVHVYNHLLDNRPYTSADRFLSRATTSQSRTTAKSVTADITYSRLSRIFSTAAYISSSWGASARPLHRRPICQPHAWVGVDDSLR